MLLSDFGPKPRTDTAYRNMECFGLPIAERSRENCQRCMGPLNGGVMAIGNHIFYIVRRRIFIPKKSVFKQEIARVNNNFPIWAI